MIYSKDNWRNDPGLKSVVIYRKKFAFLPITCKCGTQVWLKNYYTKYILWGTSHILAENEMYNLHTDKLENITEEDYIIIKLSSEF